MEVAGEVEGEFEEFARLISLVGVLDDLLHIVGDNADMQEE